MQYNLLYLKDRVLRSLQHYTRAAGLSACYYVVPDLAAARELKGIVTRLRRDFTPNEDGLSVGNPLAIPQNSMVAIFTLEALSQGWLPSPAMLERQPDPWWPGVAQPVTFYKHRLSRAERERVRLAQGK